MNFELEEQTKLTNWEKEPKLKDLKADLKAAKSFHDSQMLKIKEWKDLLFVEGKEKPKVKEGKSSVQPKLIRRQAEWRYSALTEPFLGSQKIFQVNPRTFEDIEAARQNEILLNYQFDTKINKIKFIDELVRTTVNEGTSIVRVGWERVTVPVMEPVPTYQFLPIQDEQQQQAIDQAIELEQKNPRAYDETIPDDMKKAIEFFKETQQYVVAQPIGMEMVPSEQVIENKPILEIMNPENVYIDPSCQGDISKAMFIITSFETSKAELVKTGLYQNLDKINWDDDSLATDTEHESSVPSDVSYMLKDKLRRRVVAYEYWGFNDITGSGELVPIVATWIGNTLIRMDVNPYPDEKLPFVFIPYLPLQRSAYGEADAELLKENQRILGAVTRGMIDLLGKSANSQQGFAKGFLDPTQKRRFEAGQDYEFNSGGFTPQNGYFMHQYPEIPQSAITMFQLQNEEAESLTGIKAFTGGISGEAYGDVATGIRGALDASSKREMAILRRLAKGLIEIGNKIISMNSEFLSDKEVIRVTNMQFIEIKREDIKGNFDLVVDINTAELDQAKAQDLAFMLQTLGPNFGPELVVMVLSKIADLKHLPDLAEQLRQWAPPPPDPIEEEKRQLENEKLKAEIEFLRSRAQNTAVDAQAELADMQLEVSGIKHQRNLELQQAQAQGNQDLEIIKAITKPIKENERQDPNAIKGAIGYNLQKNALKARANLLQPIQDPTLRSNLK